MDGVGRKRGNGAFAAGFEAAAPRPRADRLADIVGGRQGAGGRERDGDRVGAARGRGGGGHGTRARAAAWRGATRGGAAGHRAGRVSRRCGDEMGRGHRRRRGRVGADLKIAPRRGVRRDARRVVRSGPGEEDAARVGRQRPRARRRVRSQGGATRTRDTQPDPRVPPERSRDLSTSSLAADVSPLPRKRAFAATPRRTARRARTRAPIRCRIPTRRRQSTR